MCTIIFYPFGQADATELAEVMLANKAAILAVKEASEAGYTELMAVKDRLIASFNSKEEE